jgi:hypothetical protein
LTCHYVFENVGSWVRNTDENGVVNEDVHVPKGQLISKCPFGVIVWTKRPMKKFDKFCPTHSRAEFVKFFCWFFGPKMTQKEHFEIN